MMLWELTDSMEAHTIPALIELTASGGDRYADNVDRVR